MSRKRFGVLAIGMLAVPAGVLLSNSLTGETFADKIYSLLFLEIWWAVCSAPLLLAALLMKRKPFTVLCVAIVIAAGILAGLYYESGWGFAVAIALLLFVGALTLAVLLAARLVERLSKKSSIGGD